MSYSKATIQLSGPLAGALTNIECALIAFQEHFYPDPEIDTGVFEVPTWESLQEMIDDINAVQKMIPTECYEKWCIEDGYFDEPDG